MSSLPCCCFIAPVNFAQIAVFYCSDQPRVATAHFFEAWNNEERVFSKVYSILALGV